MGFQDSIFKITGGVAPCSYRVTICGKSGVYIEGVKRVLQICDDKIVVNVKDVNLQIVGKNLKIKSFTESDLGLTGLVLKVEVAV